LESNKRTYYWKVLKKNWKPISELTLLMITLPLYIFFTLPPIKITAQVPQEHFIQVANVKVFK